MRATPKYKWVVISDQILTGGTSGRAMRVGPDGASEKVSFAHVVRKGEAFRLRDRQGNIRFTGKILGEYEGPEPLEDFGRDNECVRIEYQRENRWVDVSQRERTPESLGYEPPEPLVPDLVIPE